MRTISSPGQLLVGSEGFQRLYFMNVIFPNSIFRMPRDTQFSGLLHSIGMKHRLLGLCMFAPGTVMSLEYLAAVALKKTVSSSIERNSWDPICKKR